MTSKDRSTPACHFELAKHSKCHFEGAKYPACHFEPNEVRAGKKGSLSSKHYPSVPTLTPFGRDTSPQEERSFENAANNPLSIEPGTH